MKSSYSCYSLFHIAVAPWSVQVCWQEWLIPVKLTTSIMFNNSRWYKGQFGTTLFLLSACHLWLLRRSLRFLLRVLRAACFVVIYDVVFDRLQPLCVTARPWITAAAAAQWPASGGNVHQGGRQIQFHGLSCERSSRAADQTGRCRFRKSNVWSSFSRHRFAPCVNTVSLCHCLSLSGAVCQSGALPLFGLRLVSAWQERKPKPGAHRPRHHLPVQRRHQPCHHLAALSFLARPFHFLSHLIARLLLCLPVPVHCPELTPLHTHQPRPPSTHHRKVDRRCTGQGLKWFHWNKWIFFVRQA